MNTLYQKIKSVFPHVANTIIHYNKTGEFKGFRNDGSVFAEFDDKYNPYNIRVRFNENNKELGIKIREGGHLIIDIGVPFEQIDSEQVLIDAVKEEIELIIARWERIYDEFEK